MCHNLALTRWFLSCKPRWLGQYCPKRRWLSHIKVNLRIYWSLISISISSKHEMHVQIYMSFSYQFSLILMSMKLWTWWTDIAFFCHCVKSRFTQNLISNSKCLSWKKEKGRIMRTSFIQKSTTLVPVDC